MSNHFFQAVRDAATGPLAPFVKGGENGGDFTYADLFHETGKLANLLSSLGVLPGDRVAVQTEKSLTSLLLYLACLRAGVVYLPFNPAYTLAEMSYFIGDAEPKIVVCAPEREKDYAGSRHDVLTLDGQDHGSLIVRAQAHESDFSDVSRQADDLAAILYTSGTTGRSKGAMLTHGNLLSNARTLKEVWRFSSSDVLLHALPIYHSHGLFVATNTVLAANASMILLPKYDADGILAKIGDATVMMGVPTFYTRLLDHAGLTKEAVSHMRLFISGSAPLLAETHQRWRERTGHAILERYGLTETNMNSSNPYDGERRAGTVGFPLPGIDLRIVDLESAAPLAQGEIGMIEVKGPNVCKGYWRNDEKTKAEFREDGFFITGDLGKVDKDGYVHIVGRAKDLVITGGFNVYPKEVEDALDALPDIEESAVFGVPDPDFGEAVTAAVVLRKGAELDESGIIAAIAAKLAKFKLPKKIQAVPELPRNAMGKVRKNVLRERFSSPNHLEFD